MYSDTIQTRLYKMATLTFNILNDRKNKLSTLVLSKRMRPYASDTYIVICTTYELDHRELRDERSAFNEPRPEQKVISTNQIEAIFNNIKAAMLYVYERVACHITSSTIDLKHSLESILYFNGTKLFYSDITFGNYTNQEIKELMENLVVISEGLAQVKDR